eukprot:4045749-Lingulodinium_polyedra.AAC.1
MPGSWGSTEASTLAVVMSGRSPSVVSAQPVAAQALWRHLWYFSELIFSHASPTQCVTRMRRSPAESAPAL